MGTEVITGRIELTDAAINKKAETSMSKQMARYRLEFEHIKAVMDALPHNPQRYIIRLEDMGLVYTTHTDKALVTEYEIKPIEKEFSSLPDQFNQMASATGWDGEAYTDFNKMQKEPK